MAEWIGHFIANWPFWAVAVVLLITSITWILYNLGMSGAEIPWQKKEWWQDRHKRLENEIKSKQAKLKVKKG